MLKITMHVQEAELHGTLFFQAAFQGGREDNLQVRTPVSNTSRASP